MNRREITCIIIVQDAEMLCNFIITMEARDYTVGTANRRSYMDMQIQRKTKIDIVIRKKHSKRKRRLQSQQLSATDVKGSGKKKTWKLKQ